MEATKQKEQVVTTVQVKKAAHERLKAYRAGLSLRPSMLDLATAAIDEYVESHTTKSA